MKIKMIKIRECLIRNPKKNRSFSLLFGIYFRGLMIYDAQEEIKLCLIS